MRKQILLVDDEQMVRDALKMRLEETGEFAVDVAETGEETLLKIRQAPSKYRLVLMDYRLGEENGARVTEEVLKLYPRLTLLILSGDESRQALKDSWASGAAGFLEKGSDDELFVKTIRDLCRPTSVETQVRASAIGLVGVSETLADIARKTIKYRDTSENVLILGETGTGKERVARALHAGEREKFFAVNCASFAGDTALIESELFGHQKGSFTGAGQEHLGIFRAAEGGTVFLDELHTLSLMAQQKLLRCLQEKTVRPLGAVKEFPVSFRLVAAAKANLLELVHKGEVLPDLYERLNVLTIKMPALREHKEDIPSLARHFCQEYVMQTGKPRNLSQGVLEALLNYEWPRNVRELENTVRRLCIDSEAETVGVDLLDDRFSPRPGLEPVQMREQISELVKAQVLSAIEAGESKRAAAKRLGIPDSSFRRLLKKIQPDCGRSN